MIIDYPRDCRKIQELNCLKNIEQTQYIKIQICVKYILNNNLLYDS